MSFAKFVILLMTMLFLHPKTQADPGQKVQSPSRNEGGEVGNGGDLLTCKPDAQMGLAKAGFYSLDYVLAYNQNNYPSTVENLEQSLQRLRALFAAKLPELSASFADFSSQILNSDTSKTRFWQPTKLQLINIKDENIGSTHQVPKACRVGEDISIVQAVIRQNESFAGTHHFRIYDYIPAVVSELTISNPLQLSFLLIHEWLWDHSLNVERNRRLNYFFHSEQFSKMDRSSILAFLSHAGMELPNLPPDIYNSNTCQADPSQIPQLIRRGRIHQDMPQRKRMAISNFVIQSRGRYCATNCSEWTSLETIENGILPNRKIVLHLADNPKFFSVASADGSTQSKDHSLCQYDSLGKVTCKPWVNKFDHTWSLAGNEPLQYSGIATNECLRLTANQFQRINDKEWYEFESVIFAKIKPNN